MMRWAGHVARVEEGRGAYRIWWGDVWEREPLVDLDVDGKIILTWILKMCDGTRPGLIWLRTGHVASSFEHGHKISGFIKCGEFLDWLRNC